MLLEGRSRSTNARRRSRSALIFVSARKHVLMSDNSRVRKNYFDSNIVLNQNVRILGRFSNDYLKRTLTEAHVYMRHHQSAKCEHFDISDVIYHNYSLGAASCTLS